MEEMKFYPERAAYVKEFERQIKEDDMQDLWLVRQTSRVPRK